MTKGSIYVKGTVLAIPDTKIAVENVLPGAYVKFGWGNAWLYLHVPLSVEVATTLSIWEDLRYGIKITKNESDKVIGIAIPRKLDV